MLVWIDEDNCEDDGRSTEVPKCLYGGGIPQALKREADVSSHGAEARRGRLRLRGGLCSAWDLTVFDREFALHALLHRCSQWCRTPPLFTLYSDAWTRGHAG